MRAVRFLLLVILLNIVRYIVASLPVEGWLVERMWGVMESHPSLFNTSFTTMDWVTSYGFNFVWWCFTALLFLLTEERWTGPTIVRSLKAYGLSFLAFASISGIYMNHYAVGREIYVWSVLDAAVVMPIVAIANGLLFRPIMRHRNVP